MRYFFYLLPLILFPYFDLSAQTNPDNNNSLSDSDSIVIIQKDPVIVRKVLLIEEDVKTSNFYFEAFTSTFINKNYYNVCEECKAYLSNIKAATKPSVGYSSGANLIYLKNHLLTSFGASYTQVREVFNYHGEGKSINNFDYIDFNLSGGYRINKKRLSIAIIG